ncbi:MAG: chemotaxis protein CheD [Methylobacter sp.]|nr:MAG: chemotaxis protein CheD [Methylobacter sp.]
MMMSLHSLEIFLQPGTYYFAGRDSRICTVLGSCVSMTFWHPRLLVGGMCHYLLPERAGTGGRSVPDGRYADEAIVLLLKKMDVVGASYKEYQVKLFGGGNMFPEMPKKNSQSLIGIKNVHAAQRLTKQYGFTCVAEHLGGVGYRRVMFDVWSGEVWVKHTHVLPVAKY